MRINEIIGYILIGGSVYLAGLIWKSDFKLISNFFTIFGINSSLLALILCIIFFGVGLYLVSPKTIIMLKIQLKRFFR